MKFFCLCMSPAIDATVTLPRAPKGDGEIFKDVAEEENVGGKTVNVARWLALRGADVACGGLLGEDNDRPFAKELAKYGIEDRFMRVAGATRRNEMIVWPGGSMKLNRSAFPGLGNGERGTGNGERGIFEEVLSRLSGSSQMSRGSGVAILSGSLPPAVPKDFYARAVAAFKAQDWLTVLDASGEAMRLGLEERPDFIKPNAEECEPLVGFVPKTPEEFARATAMLREKAAHVVISDGGAGAWFDGEFVPAPKVEVVDTTAAGDTLLAEFCWRMFGDLGNGERGMGNAGRWAVAAGSAACTMPGGAPPAQELVEQLCKGVL
jgi:1-phosphofructokinase